jgi:hypothetical protein
MLNKTMMIKYIKLILLLISPFFLTSQNVSIKDTTGYMIVVNCSQGIEMEIPSHLEVQFFFYGVDEHFKINDSLDATGYGVIDEIGEGFLKRGVTMIETVLSSRIKATDDEWLYTDMDLYSTILDDNCDNKIMFKSKKYYFKIWLLKVEIEFFKGRTNSSPGNEVIFATKLVSYDNISKEDKHNLQYNIESITGCKRLKKKRCWIDLDDN